MAALSEAVNPSMIVLARESRGMTQSMLAESANVSQGHLSKMESGLWPVGDQVLDRLVEVLHYPPPFFYQKEVLYGPGVSEFYHRKRQSASVILIKQAHAKINLFLIQLAKLLRGADLGECSIPKFDKGDLRTVEECAQALRAMWHLPPGPINNLVQAVENAGGIVIRCAFGTPTIDGISRWAPGLPPVFFINEDSPMDRARLTLAHELGHMVLHDMPSAEMEDEANTFAREFLMPGREVKRQLENLNLHRLATLKPHWRVSMAALLYAAEDLGAVSERTARHLWVQMGPYKRREPPELDLPAEEPQLFNEVLKLYRETFAYSVDQLSEYLALFSDELQTSYKLQPDKQARPQIRLLK
jgi:Zn-dependent peptidase ImmA (M78 family)/transcriptional regulator with XRE-family HTH domain